MRTAFRAATALLIVSGLAFSLSRAADEAAR